MDYSLVEASLQLVVSICIPLFAGVAVGALVSGVFQAATQIQDPIFGQIGKLVGIGVVILTFGTNYSSQVISFASRIWGGADFFH